MRMQVPLVDRWDSYCNDTSSTLALMANVFYDIKMEYKQIIGTAFVRLAWSSASVTKELVPSSQFYYDTQTQKSPFGLAITPNAANGAQSIASGGGSALPEPSNALPHPFTATFSTTFPRLGMAVQGLSSLRSDKRLRAATRYFLCLVLKRQEICVKYKSSAALSLLTHGLVGRDIDRDGGHRLDPHNSGSGFTQTPCVPRNPLFA